MTVSININGLEPITEALNNLAQALGAHGVTASLKDGTAKAQGTPQAQGAPPQQVPQSGLSGGLGGIPGGIPGSAAPLPVQGVTPQPGWPGWPGWPGSVPQANGAGAGSAPAGPAPAMGPLPTTASPRTYTQDQIAVAMTGLVDQGKQPQVMQVLAQFGAGSLMQVPKEQYPALAAQLRMLGAAI